MCGIAGYLHGLESGGIDFHIRTIRNMTDAIKHRGPDDEGWWCDAEAGIALGNRRLSIVDLSPQGHQPMVSASGRYVIAFNGEIYNHETIRREIASGAGGAVFPSHDGPIAWRGRSDTEVMLAAVETWGLHGAVLRFTGMFAFALWDRVERVLHLVRDRVGEKPLYYGWTGTTFLFGSEIKALKTHPAWNAQIDRNALALFLRHNYIPAPHSIYRGIRKLLPGTVLSIPHDARRGTRPADQPEPAPYWSARETAERGIEDPYRGSDREAADRLEDLLRDAIGQQMVADVPLGAFLSGGIDSSTVVALMQAQSARPVKTFTIGFHDKIHNEAEHAAAVAEHLGTDHTEMYVTAGDALAVIPKIPSLYDEPFADSSQIPTFLISSLTRNHVTVSLSGDAGDELFAGYTRYFLARSLSKKFGRMPRSMRTASAAFLRSIPPRFWDALLKNVAPVISKEMKQRLPGDTLHKLSELMDVDGPIELYGRLCSHWKDPAAVVLHAEEPATIMSDRARWPSFPDYAQNMMFLDLVTYLPDDILVKVDRAAMGVSLETRIPFLDHRIVEFAWQLPMSMKIRNGQGKWLLRQVLYKHVPREMIERPKSGFSVPIASWLRGPLRGWAEELLDEKRLLADRFFDPRPIRTKWLEHLSGTRNWHHHLWDILMFQAWLEKQ